MRVVPVRASPSHRQVSHQRERQAPGRLDAGLLPAVRPHVEDPHPRARFVQALGRERLLRFGNNDPAMVRYLVMDGALAGKAGYQLDWSGTWELDTGMPSAELQREDPAPLEVIIRFELPAPIRVIKLLMIAFGLSRSALAGMADSGRIGLPMAIDTKARDGITLVITTPPSPRIAADQQARPLTWRRWQEVPPVPLPSFSPCCRPGLSGVPSPGAGTPRYRAASPRPGQQSSVRLASRPGAP
jgi:Protein of unknown function (DUF1062)